MHIELTIALLLGWLLDLCLGDPSRLPHPIVWFGKWISYWEHRLNHGRHLKFKGAVLAVGSIVLVFCVAWLITRALDPRLLEDSLRAVPHRCLR